MIISIVNRSNSILDEELQTVIRAINRQIAEDFQPYWSFGATLRLEGKVGKKPDTKALPELRGDAVIYLWDETDVEDALGYHDSNALGIPYGFVFTALSKELGESWTVTLSHEALELLGDAQGNLLVQGPHPDKPALEVFHWFEMCDAVQSQTYRIDDVEVANFVLPLYFTLEEQEGGRNDFLGRLDKGKGLSSFGVAPGGYVGFFNPRTREHEQWSPPEDKKAHKRLAIKGKAKFGRGYLRSRFQAPAGRERAHAEVLKGRHMVKASATPENDPIKHVVVLMLENRSFDHMLGGMSRIDPNVEGVRYANPYCNSAKGRKYQQNPVAKWVVSRDLDHEHEGTMQELGTGSSPMSGFVSMHLKRYPNATDAELEQVMAYFPFGNTPQEDALPVLHTLARNFAVCDHWFSSMPGPTWQNRFFVHSGTSLGHTKMPSASEPGEMRIYYQETIFDRLSESGIDWKIFHDGIPQSIVLTRLLTRYLTFRGYADMDDFQELAAGDPQDFPQYAFIEPCYFGVGENDQHPPADVRRGEKLIADVYNAIRANPALWASTLLVITCDEHGGFYDHVPPPATVPPDDHIAEWTFDRLGVRVPTILVSPWVKKGVIKTDFEHTSLLRYLCEKWNLEPLGGRMQVGAGNKRANNFAAELARLTEAREDTPQRLEAAPIPRVRGTVVAKEPPITGFREALLMYVDQLPENTPAPALVKKSAAMRGKQARRGAKPMHPEPLSFERAEEKLERLRKKKTAGT